MCLVMTFSVVCVDSSLENVLSYTLLIKVTEVNRCVNFF